MSNYHLQKIFTWRIRTQDEWDQSSLIEILEGILLSWLLSTSLIYQGNIMKYSRKQFVYPRSNPKYLASRVCALGPCVCIGISPQETLKLLFVALLFTSLNDWKGGLITMYQIEKCWGKGWIWAALWNIFGISWSLSINRDHYFGLKIVYLKSFCWLLHVKIRNNFKVFEMRKLLCSLKSHFVQQSKFQAGIL